jgi:hypothetical protein
LTGRSRPLVGLCLPRCPISFLVYSVSRLGRFVCRLLRIDEDPSDLLILEETTNRSQPVDAAQNGINLVPTCSLALKVGFVSRAIASCPAPPFLSF